MTLRDATCLNASGTGVETVVRKAGRDNGAEQRPTYVRERARKLLNRRWDTTVSASSTRALPIERDSVRGHPIALARDGHLKQEVFDRFAHGLIVLDRNGRVLCANTEASRVLDTAITVLNGANCCELLGCRQAGRVCLTRLAAQNANPVPEMRLDLHRSSDTQSIWVSAFPLGDGAPRVMLVLRSADPRDRRSCVNPHWRRIKTLSIATLGRTSVSTGGAPIERDWLDKRVGQLLRYLVVRRDCPVTADEIGESLWRSADYSVARNVRTCVHRLRNELEPGRNPREPSAYILTRGGSYRLNPETVKVDVDQFEADLTDGFRLMSCDAVEARRRLEAGLDLYEGEFLPDIPFAEWAAAERGRLHEIACRAMRALAELHAQAGCTSDVRSCLERLARLQPLDESVCRELIEIDIADGRGTDAKRRYDRLGRMMAETLGRGPRFTLEALARATPRIP